MLPARVAADSTIAVFKKAGRRVAACFLIAYEPWKSNWLLIFTECPFIRFLWTVVDMRKQRMTTKKVSSIRHGTFFN